MKHVLLLVMFAILLAGCGGDRELLNRSEDAALPESAAARIKTATLVYAVSTAQHPDLTVTVRYMAPDRYRYDLSTNDGDTAILCLAGERSWGYSSDHGILTLTPAQIDELRNEAMILPFRRNFDERFTGVRKTGEAEVNGEQCWLLECDANAKLAVDGPVKLYISKETGLLIRSESMIGGKLLRTELFDYRNVDGVKLAGAIYEEGPRGVVRTKLLSADWNTPLPEIIFNPPKPFVQ